MKIYCGTTNDFLAKCVLAHGYNLLNKDSLTEPHIFNYTDLKCILVDSHLDDKYEVKFALNNTNIIKYENLELIIQIKQNNNHPLKISNNSYIHTEVFIECNQNNDNIFKIIEKFIRESKKYYKENIQKRNKTEDHVSIYMCEDGYWCLIDRFKKRPLNTLYFHDNIQNKIFEELKDFLKKDTEDEYNKFGMRYKKNILLHGYPGVGKSSLVFALASALNFNIALVHFDAKTTDAMFMNCIQRQEEDSILLLEDIDVLFQERKKNDKNNSSLTFSTLINALDGVASKHKQIIFMTTNYKCNLDKALIRAGRVDSDYYFDFSTKEQIQKMFDNFVPKQKDKFKSFYSKIKNRNVTTAPLQQYLFKYRKHENILENIDELIELLNECNYQEKKMDMYM